MEGKVLFFWATGKKEFTNQSVLHSQTHSTHSVFTTFGKTWRWSTKSRSTGFFSELPKHRHLSSSQKPSNRWKRCTTKRGGMWRTSSHSFGHGPSSQPASLATSRRIYQNLWTGGLRRHATWTPSTSSVHTSGNSTNCSSQDARSWQGCPRMPSHATSKWCSPNQSKNHGSSTSFRTAWTSLKSSGAAAVSPSVWLTLAQCLVLVASSENKAFHVGTCAPQSSQGGSTQRRLSFGRGTLTNCLKHTRERPFQLISVFSRMMAWARQHKQGDGVVRERREYHLLQKSPRRKAWRAAVAANVATTNELVRYIQNESVLNMLVCFLSSDEGVVRRESNWRRNCHLLVFVQRFVSTVHRSITVNQSNHHSMYRKTFHRQYVKCVFMDNPEFLQTIDSFKCRNHFIHVNAIGLFSLQSRLWSNTQFCSEIKDGQDIHSEKRVVDIDTFVIVSHTPRRRGECFCNVSYGRSSKPNRVFDGGIIVLNWLMSYWSYEP